MPPQQQHQRTPQILGQQRQRDRSHNAPHYQRMPLPSPYLVKQAQRVMAQMLNFSPAQRKLPRVEQMHPQIYERNKQHDVQRRHNCDPSCDATWFSPSITPSSVVSPTGVMPITIPSATGECSISSYT